MADENAFPSETAVREFLRERVLPLLAPDRGSVELGRLDRAARRIVLRYADACAGCPGLSVTHDVLVVPLLRREFPGVDAIDATIMGERDSNGKPKT